MKNWDHPLYRLWKAMRQRCNNPNATKYYLYGGKGVTICDRWNDFWLFVEDMDNRPSPRHTIDRKDGSKGYSPDNCRWATPAEQNRNHSRNRYINHDGIRLTVRDWEIRNGMKEGFYSMRLMRGWSEIDTLTKPLCEYARRTPKKKITEKTNVQT